MDRLFTVIPPKYLVGGAGILLLLTMMVSCKKQEDCVPGTKKYSTTKGIQKSSKSGGDPCEFEQNAVNTADSLLNYVYGPDVCNAIDPALYYPDNISGMYWNYFRYDFEGNPFFCETFMDSVVRHGYTIDALWEKYGNPLPKNDENVKKLPSAITHCRQF
jgi:hypothetical protein